MSLNSLRVSLAVVSAVLALFMLAGCRSHPQPRDPFENPRFDATSSPGVGSYPKDQGPAILADPDYLEFEPEQLPGSADSGKPDLLPFEVSQAELEVPPQPRQKVSLQLTSAQDGGYYSGAISGTVLDESGRPVPNARVLVIEVGRNAGQRGEVATDQYGRFAVRGLRPRARHLVLGSLVLPSGTMIGRLSAMPPDRGLKLRLTRSRFSTQQQVQARPRTSVRPSPIKPPVTAVQPTAPRRSAASKAPPLLPWDTPPPPLPQGYKERLRLQNSRSQSTSNWRPIRPSTPASASSNVARPGSQPDIARSVPVPRRQSQPKASAQTTRLPQIPFEAADPFVAKRQLPSQSQTAVVPACQFSGSRLVDFTLPDLNQRPVSFRTLEKPLVLVDFWATWCGPCLSAIPHLTALKKKYGNRGFEVVGISYDGKDESSVNRIRRRTSELGVNYPILLEELSNSPVRSKFQVAGFPTLILLDDSGRTLWRADSLPDHYQMRQLEQIIVATLAR